MQNAAQTNKICNVQSMVLPPQLLTSTPPLLLLAIRTAQRLLLLQIRTRVLVIGLRLLRY
jgi:hypothetical protein